MLVPDVPIRLDDGTTTPLTDLYREAPLALVFLRHAGCVFCRYQVAQLRPFPDLNLCFVCMEDVEEARAFKEGIRSPHRFISDPQRELYNAFGLPQAGFSQILNVRTLKRGMEAMRAGYRNSRPTSDARQLGGTFILDVKGQVVWSHQSEDAGDLVTGEQIRERLEGLGQPKI